MKTVTVERVTWVLILGGLLTLSMSWFIDPAMRYLQIGFAVAGGLAAAVGAVLIFVRSRMKGDAS